MSSCRIKNSRDIWTDSLCTNKLLAKAICADALTVNADVCLKNLNVTGDLCVGGSLRANDICQPYRATVSYSASTPYTLGTDLAFDNIQDDPNNNITLAPTTYTAPRSGYYLLGIEVSQEDLVASVPILGVPTAEIDVIVNGVLAHTSQFPYLTFQNAQRSLLTTIIRLNAGDVVRSRYNIIAVDPSTGVTNVVGTVTMLDGPIPSLFQIHYLSSDCASIPCPTACSACDTVCATPCGECIL